MLPEPGLNPQGGGRGLGGKGGRRRRWWGEEPHPAQLTQPGDIPPPAGVLAPEEQGQTQQQPWGGWVWGSVGAPQMAARAGLGKADPAPLLCAR